MAGLFRQLTSKLKSGFTTLLEPAEDPREVFLDPRQRQQNLLARVREALTQNADLCQHLESRVSQVRDQLPKLEHTARQALAAGREDTARQALRQRQLALSDLKTLEGCVKEVALEEGRIGLIEQHLSAQVESLNVKQELVAARYTAAESQMMAQEAITDINNDLSYMGLALEQVEQNTEQMQARTTALNELVDPSLIDALPSAGEVARQLQESEVSRAVEAELARLKRGEGDLPA
jgi:phage shock protein A